MNTEKKTLNKRLKKYYTNTCNREEFDELFVILKDKKYNKTLNRLLADKWEEQAKPATFHREYYTWYASIAAAILVLFATTFFIRQFSDASDKQLPTQSMAAEVEIKRVVLSDGSVITLRGDSKLSYPNHFDGATREVTLDGEAYFDIAHNAAKPFIIHTGAVKTTVLGTAFSIKALPGDEQITVTVSQGKVKVEDQKNLLAVLEADKQFIYDKNSMHTEEKLVDAAKEVAWKSHDLVFKNVSFSSIVEELGTLYHARIEFDSEVLQKKLITASIDGSESLDRILEMLCTTQHASFVFENEIYKINEIK